LFIQGSLIDTWLKRVRETPRKVMKYKEANWDQVKKDLENTLTTINNIYEKSDTNILWNTSPIGGRVHNLLRFDGLFIRRRSNVLSFRVGLSVT
jgi:hypothetical protein